MAGSNTSTKAKAVAKPKPKPKPKHPGGRPTKKDIETVKKLIAGFNNGFNDTEACSYSGISRETFYKWIKNDREFSDIITNAKAYPNKKAKEVILEGMAAGNTADAKWWLERKDPDFKAKGELKLDGEIPVALVRFIGKDGNSKDS